MREIKYRAWDKVDRVMRSWENLILTKDKGDDFYLVGYEENSVITNFDHSVELMQYTGLKPFVGILTIGTQRITISGQTYDHELYDYKVLGHKYQYPELMGVAECK